MINLWTIVRDLGLMEKDYPRKEGFQGWQAFHSDAKILSVRFPWGRPVDLNDDEGSLLNASVDDSLLISRILRNISSHILSYLSALRFAFHWVEAFLKARQQSPNFNGEIGLHMKSNFNRLYLREENFVSRFFSIGWELKFHGGLPVAIIEIGLTGNLFPSKLTIDKC